MLTIFAIPKAFQGHTGIIQRNAIKSWTLLRPACEVILCGDDPGVAEAASELGVRHLPDIERNEYGTPLLTPAFQQAAAASNQLLCYVNADIILMNDFVRAARRIWFRRFMMVGQRWDLDVKEPLDFADEWEDGLRARIRAEGILLAEYGIDYFCFPAREQALLDLHEFPVGRPAWDNWLVYRARQLGIPLIDATHATSVVHQNHDYGHVPLRSGDMWEGPEAERSRAWSKELGMPELFTIRDATHVLNRWALLPILAPDRVQRFLHTAPLLYPRTAQAIELLRWPFLRWHRLQARLESRRKR